MTATSRGGSTRLRDTLGASHVAGAAIATFPRAPSRKNLGFRIFHLDPLARRGQIEVYRLFRSHHPRAIPVMSRMGSIAGRRGLVTSKGRPTRRVEGYAV